MSAYVNTSMDAIVMLLRGSFQGNQV